MKNKMHPVMNNTKWDEIWCIGNMVPGRTEWRSKNLKTGNISNWTDDWRKTDKLFNEYKKWEWLEIKFNGNKELIINILKTINPPVKYLPNSIMIFGYVSNFEEIEHLK